MKITWREKCLDFAIVVVGIAISLLLANYCKQSEKNDITELRIANMLIECGQNKTIAGNIKIAFDDHKDRINRYYYMSNFIEMLLEDENLYKVISSEHVGLLGDYNNRISYVNNIINKYDKYNVMNDRELSEETTNPLAGEISDQSSDIAIICDSIINEFNGYKRNNSNEN